MNWFKDPTTEKLKKQLKDSQADFLFDKAGIKNHLMQSIHSYKQKPAIILPGKRNRAPLWTHTLAVLVLFLSSATLAFADSAKPGDKLFFLDKLQENATLAIPLPSQQKADVHAKIVKERVTELQKLKAENNRNEVKVRAIQESEASVTQALESVTEVKSKLESRGKTKQAEKLNQVLIKLDGLAENNETEIEDIKKNWRKNKDKDEEKYSEKADKSLHEIKRIRLKARIQNPDHIWDRSGDEDDSDSDSNRDSD